MKNKLKITFCAAFAASICIIGVSRSLKSETTALTLTNVEALTDKEISIDFEYDKCCIEDPDLNCLPNFMGLIPGLSIKC